MISNPELMTLIGHCGLIVFTSWTFGFIFTWTVDNLDDLLREMN